MGNFNVRNEIEDIKIRLTKIETTLDDVHQQVTNHLPTEIKKLSGRPSWIILSFITILTSLVVGLIMALLK